MELMGLFLFTQLYRLNPLKKAGALKFVSLALKIPRPALNIARAPLKIPALALKKTGALQFVSPAQNIPRRALNITRAPLISRAPARQKTSASQHAAPAK